MGKPIKRKARILTPSGKRNLVQRQKVIARNTAVLRKPVSNISLKKIFGNPLTKAYLDGAAKRIKEEAKTESPWPARKRKRHP
ncbi:MAG: hypothetical protein ABH986_01000 [archaeon]